MNKYFKDSNSIDYLLLCIITSVLLVLVYKLWDINILKYPIQFQGDSIMAYVSTQMIHEDGLFGAASRYGTPFHTNNLDFYDGAMISRIIRWIMVTLTGNAILSVNVYFFFGFFLASCTSYYSLRKISVSRISSFIVSILYTFIPFHMYRGVMHLTYSQYWIIPLVILYVINYCLQTEKVIASNKRRALDWKHIAVIILIGGHNVYYAYFSCFLLFISIIINLLKRNYYGIKKALIDIAEISTMFFVFAIPYFLNQIIHGKNSGIASRNIEEIQIYALKLGHLLLPSIGNRVRALRNISTKFNELSYSNENEFATLGILLSIGFIALIIELFRYEHDDCVLHILAVLMVSCLLLSITGGFNSIIGLVFSNIRAYNRISIFIAFFAAISLGKLLDKLFSSVQQNFIRYPVSIIILLLGIFDQTIGISDLYQKDAWNEDDVNTYGYYKALKMQWNDDEQYFSNLENTVKEGAHIYQMPYMQYPENPSINKISDYMPFIGYLHTQKLCWSYGCIKGRCGDKWNTSLGQLELKDQIKQIVMMDFDGVLIDSFGFDSDTYAVFKGEVEEILSTAPIVDDKGRYYYYSLEQLKKQLCISAEEYKQAHLLYYYGDGISYEETDGKQTWNWCDTTGTIDLYNATNDICKVNIRFDCHFPDEQCHSIIIKDKKNKVLEDYFFEENMDGCVGLNIDIYPGESGIIIESDCDRIDAGDDPRKLAFMIKNISVSFE